VGLPSVEGASSGGGTEPADPSGEDWLIAGPK